MRSYSETTEAISLHGLGFIQVKLWGKQRLHVWHPDLPRRACWVSSQIHDHRFGFLSTILVGDVTNRFYRIVPGGKPTHLSYLHEGERTEKGNRPWKLDDQVSVKLAHQETYFAGQSYMITAYSYHSTALPPNGIAATVIKKTHEGNRGAHSLCVLGEEPDVDFDRRQWNDDQLWAIVRNVMERKDK